MKYEREGEVPSEEVARRMVPGISRSVVAASNFSSRVDISVGGGGEGLTILVRGNSWLVPAVV